MNRKIYVMIALFIFLVVGAWFGSGWYASKVAEDKLQAIVSKSGLQGFVRWESVSANLLQEVTVKKVTLGPKNELLIDEVYIKDFEDSSSKQLVDVQLRGLKDAQGNAPEFLLFSLDKRSATINPHPLDMNLVLNLDYGDDEGFLQLMGISDNLAQLDVLIELNSIAVLRPWLERVAQQQSMFAILMQAEDILEKVYFKKASISVKDFGGMKRFISLAQRYDDVPLPTQRKGEAYQQRVDQNMQECMQAPFIQKAKQSCEKLGAFLQGKESALNLNIKTTAPISLFKLLNANWQAPREKEIQVEIN